MPVGSNPSEKTEYPYLPICNRTDLMAGFWYFEGAVADGAHLLEFQRRRILLLQSMWTEARKQAGNRIHLTDQVDTVPGMVKQILPSYGSFLQS